MIALAEGPLSAEIAPLSANGANTCNSPGVGGGRRAESERRARAFAERERLRRVVRRVTCSEPWAEAAMRAAIELGVRPSRGDAAAVLAMRGIYPPPADTSPMRSCRCAACQTRGRKWPAPFIGSSGYSLECAYESADENVMADLPGTVSTVDLSRVRAGNRVRKW